jgi:virulence factor Mce-like protein
MRRRPSRARLRIGDLAAGGAVLALVIALTLYAFAGLMPFHNPYRVYALVRDANQLRPGSPVRVDGIDAGAVNTVERGTDGDTRLAMTISSEALPLHADATLRIRPRTFLEGGFFVDLSPGTPEAPVLPAGATLPPAATTGPVQFSQVLSTFTASYRDGMRNILAQTATGLGGAGALRTLAPQLTPTLRDAAWIAQAARGSEPHDLSLLIRSTASVTGALALEDQELVGLVSGLRTTTAALTARPGALSDSVANLDALVREAPPALSALDGALPVLGRFSVVADPAVRQAPPLVAGLSRAVSQFGSLVAPAERQRVVAALRAAVVQLPTLLRSLTSAFPPIQPSAECLVQRVVPVLQASVPDGSLSTGEPAWQDLLHALVGLAGNAQDFDGNGFWQRYLAGGGSQTVSLPVAGGLVGTIPGASALLGARPVWLGPGSAPPLRPDAPCIAQPLVRLASATAPPPASAAAGDRRGSRRPVVAHRRGRHR